MKKPRRLHILLALGNPGTEYGNTYHNAGVLALEHMEKSLRPGGPSLDPETWKSHKKLFEYIAEPQTSGLKTIFIRPLVFMNASGAMAREVLKKFDAEPADLTVFHDDSDLPLGKFKIMHGRNSAGHKGVQSVIDVLGTNGFERVRIGVRSPVLDAGSRELEAGSHKKAGDFVLSQITPKDRKVLDAVFEEIAEEWAKKKE